MSLKQTCPALTHPWNKHQKYFKFSWKTVKPSWKNYTKYNIGQDQTISKHSLISDSNDNFRDNLTISNKIWQYWTISDNVGQYSKMFEIMFGNIWQYLTKLDKIPQYLPILENIYQSDNILQH